MWFETIRSECNEWIFKLGLFFMLAGILSVIAFQPVSPAVQAASIEPLSFEHNLFICTFEEPGERQ